ncbi:deoxyribose-phosphate aldolase [Salinarimonas ramus]|uniref:Deoxyribose-phosphate aldolase n=1 Tax=Salinarimonas ramus TaxID=690164 RepID=A0A917V253_9HYPH|nr:deoxyribose-phosphate aldolase [Salinarimonas ramus]GGK25235.1 deoxyribose-phosphate aldolase [Salinarimonas ramus]
MSDTPPSDGDLARRAIGLTDLTNLDETCTESAIDALCAKAKGGDGVPPVAAVCVWPQFVSRAKATLRGSGVRVATVVNFPTGDEDVERVVEQTREALRDGADEIDLVLPYRAFLAGEEEEARGMLAAVRERVPAERVLKVILETGELKDADAIRRASTLAIAEGADFVKTSTGKTPISATPEAARIMLETIEAAPGGRRVGLKPSGGIRTLDQARAYLDLAAEIMGEGWARPETFRFGASGLHGALVAALGGASSGDAPAPQGGSY